MTSQKYHLDALNIRLSHERSYLAQAKTEKEKEIRKVWIKQIEKEIAREKKILGMEEVEVDAISDDDLLNSLLS
ncbi:hypothetical protein EHV15_34050 [Paenibacillus oralis]|uniref:Uncharacterized protein n=1 Tax=Paenibacillus oralis TaxID=2490856 RepID=A0A3P3T9J9_9BACL|nr:hypothetical protein [Paenibacillus oralis]RRJ54622.1 hypothetical protein EHV15_34050 [Paenibacillus oralis]